MSNTYKQARTWPITKAALMFVAQQQGILENLKKKMDYYCNKLIKIDILTPQNLFSAAMWLQI